MNQNTKAIESILDTLEECQEYFDDKADADFDGDPGEFRPNQEMKLKTRVSNALKKLQLINQPA